MNKLQIKKQMVLILNIFIISTIIHMLVLALPK